MKLAALVIVVLLGFNLSCGRADEGKKTVKKLQIGVKKRVENCDQKSRRGDLLSMHYTVTTTFLKRLFKHRP